MYRRTTTALVLALALAGCSSPAEQATEVKAESEPDARTQREHEASTAFAEVPPTAADGSDVGACFDGDCEIAVSEPVDIPLEDRLRVSSLAITAITPDRVNFRFEFPSGGSGQSAAGPGGGVSVNEVNIRVVAIRGGTAVLDFSPSR